MVQQGEGSLFLWIIGGGLVGAGSYLAMSFLVRAEGAYMLFTKANAMKDKKTRSKVHE
jgi:hypothetical protein